MESGERFGLFLGAVTDVVGPGDGKGLLSIELGKKNALAFPGEKVLDPALVEPFGDFGPQDDLELFSRKAVQSLMVKRSTDCGSFRTRRHWCL